MRLSLSRCTSGNKKLCTSSLAIAQLVVARRGLVAAPLADIDSVCHVAYVEYFVQRFWPEAHALVGYTPDYNLGAPFLLFNVPPGVTWLGAQLVLAGFSAANPWVHPWLYQIWELTRLPR